MERVKEAVVTATKNSVTVENTDCCLKCKGKKNNTCSKRISSNNELQESENIEHQDLKNLQSDV